MSRPKNTYRDLLFSECALSGIPKKKFKVDSWSSLDLFMDFAAELFSFTVKELIAHGYLKIVGKHETPVRFLWIKVSSRTDYAIQRLPKSTDGLTVGWLEEKILDAFKSPQTNQLETIAHKVFSDILREKDTYINPGKVFLHELLKHQKLNRFKVEEKNLPLSLSKQIIITADDPHHNIEKECDIYVNESNHQFISITQIISTQLHRFQDSD